MSGRVSVTSPDPLLPGLCALVRAGGGIMPGQGGWEEDGGECDKHGGSGWQEYGKEYR